MRKQLSFLIFSVVLINALGGLFAPSLVEAAEKGLDQLCTPKFVGAGGDGWRSEAFQFKIISRLEIRVSYKQTGNCVRPSGLSSKYLHAPDLEFAKFVNQTLYLQRFTYNSVDKVLYAVGKNSSNSASDETILETMHWESGDGIDSQADFKNWDTYRYQTSANFTTMFKDSEYTIGIESNALNGYASCNDSSNVHLLGKNGNLIWKCDNDSANGTGMYALANLNTAENMKNFNIVFQGAAGGKTVQSIFTNDSEFTFKLCGKTFKNDNCNGNRTLTGITEAQIKDGGVHEAVVHDTTNSKNDFKVLVAGEANTDVQQNPQASGGSSSGEVGCGGQGGPLRWILCPIFTAAADLVDTIYDDYVKGMLVVSPLTDSSHPELYQIWQSLRNFANALFILVFLFIIFGNAFGIGVDEYTFKKALPRLVVAVIGVQASWLICGVIVDISNVLGNGVASLVAFTTTGTGGTGVQNLTAGLFTIISSGVALIVISQLGAWLLLLPLIIGLFISILTLLLTLAARAIIINVLVVLSPIAFVAWVLPRTEEYFKKWLDNFVKAVFMFPLIALLLAGANLTAKVSASQGGTLAVLGMLAPIIAFFMIPTMFKRAGDLVGKASEAVNKRGTNLNKRISEPVRKAGRESMHEKNALKLGEGNLLNRGLARVGSGNAFSFGKVGRRKIAASKEAAESKLIGDFEKGLIDSNFDNIQLKGMYDKGVDEKGKPLDKYQKRAILRRLGAQNGDKELISMFNASTDKEAFREDLRRGLDSGAQSRIAKKAPHLIRADREAAYVKLSGEAAAGLDSSVAQAYANNARLTDEGRFNFVNSAASISQSAGLRANANTNLRVAYLDAKANSHEYQTQTVNVNGVDMTGHQFLQAFVNSNGTVAATESLSATEVQAKIAAVAAPTRAASAPLAKHPAQP